MSDTWMNNTDDTELEDGEIILEGKDVVIRTTNRPWPMTAPAEYQATWRFWGTKHRRKKRCMGNTICRKKKY